MDDFIHALLRLIWWPYEAWKKTLENSRIGPSPEDHRTVRMWFWIATFLTLLFFLLIPIAIWFLWFR